MRRASVKRRLAFALVATAPLAFAMRGDERGGRDASLHECDALYDRGSALEANACYRGLADRGGIAARAEAQWMLGQLKAANDLFREAVRLGPEDPDLRVRWGYLYLDSHNDTEAANLFQEALELDADHVPAQLGLATVLASRFEGKAADLVEQALKLQPEQALGHLLTARMALEEGDLEVGREALEQALERVRELGRVPLETYSLLAALEMLEGNPNNDWLSKALDFNPRYGEIYAEQAHFYVITRRYSEASERLREAIRIAPGLWNAHAELGVTLLRLGEDDASRRHLEIAYDGDPYNLKTVNTLRLLDSFDQFETFEDPDDGTPGGLRAVFRLDKDESALLLPYVRSLTKRAISEFSRKYAFDLERAVRVELFPNHDDFAVRTMAMPGIGLLGVTFGYVVAMDSPSGRRPGEFHWGTTLWHELAHVFTLEATDHLVPRWYSEGISMYEEWQADPRWGESVGPEYVEAVRESALLPLAELDRGFIRPKHPGQVAISYMQAGFVCRFIAENWGEKALLGLLRGFAANKSTPANLLQVLGLATEEFDERFDGYMREFLGPAVDGLPRWRENLAKALDAARGKDWNGVLEPARAAKAAYPHHVGLGSAYVLLATALDEGGNRQAALSELLEYERRGGRNPESLKKLGRWLEEAGRSREAAHTYEGLLYNWPRDEDLHARLGELYLEAGSATLALREFEAVRAMEPLDRATAEFNLARAYVKIGDLARARRHVLLALERAPTYQPALQLLLQVKR